MGGRSSVGGGGKVAVGVSGKIEIFPPSGDGGGAIPPH